MTLYPVIMAGGSGTRFWPLSRKHRPKQFLPLGSSQPLIVDTASRLPPLSEVSDCYVVCGPAHAQAVRKLLPQIPAHQVLVEPVARNTAPAIGLAATVIAQRDPKGVLAILPSDHHVGDVPAFQKALAAGARYASEGALVALAVTPTRPETGYGYVRLGAKLGRGPGHAVRAFVEKPDLAHAKRYVKSGEYVWNAGIFLFRADAILKAIAEHLPALAHGLDALAPHVGHKSFGPALKRIFPTLPSISIDYGVMEKARDIAVVPSAFGWSDVGSFATLPEVRPVDDAGNVLDGLALPIDTHGCVILGQKSRPVAVVGVRDLMVIDAGDAILVCPKSRAQEVRRVVDALAARKLSRFL